MATQLSTGGSVRVEREDGDACQRFGCTGLLHPHGKIRGEDVMECSGCHFTFATIFSLPAGPPHGQGEPPEVTIPSVVIERFARLLLQRNQEIAVPNPNDRTSFEDLPPNLQRGHIKDAEALLTPIWTEVADWFGFSLDDRENQQNAGNAISEIAIPALKHCEEHYNYGARARRLLEAAIGSEAG